jgi:hypothetical protein
VTKGVSDAQVGPSRMFYAVVRGVKRNVGG